MRTSTKASANSSLVHPDGSSIPNSFFLAASLGSSIMIESRTCQNYDEISHAHLIIGPLLVK